MTELLFGVQAPPRAGAVEFTVEVAQAADEGGLELLGVQDHPYVADFLDTFTLMGHLLDKTSRIRIFPDVANLPLRPPAMLAKTAATLDLLSGGRFELGLGSGAAWHAVAAMGGGELKPGEALKALEEGVEVIRALWRAGETARVDGQFHHVSGVHTGPAPAHPIGIWFGSVGPRANRLTGRIADGWAAPIPSYLPYESWAAAHAAIDAGAHEAGRDPDDILRIAQIVGTITPENVANGTDLAGDRPLRGSVAQWVKLLSELATSTPFRGFVLWPEDLTLDQVNLFAREVAPAVRAASGDGR